MLFTTASVGAALLAAALTPGQIVQVTADFTQTIGTQPMSYGTNEVPNQLPQSAVAGPRLAEMRTNWCRLWVNGDTVSLGPGLWNWSLLDVSLYRIHQAGAKPMICFAGIPDWMAESPNPGGPSTWNHPRDLVEWADYCIAIAQHCESLGYPVQDWLWEVWNEPNNQGVSGGWNIHEYAALYDAAAEALTSAYPGLRVGGPSTDGAWRDWTDLMLEPGRIVHFITWHRYGAWDPSLSLPTESYLAGTSAYGWDASHVESWIEAARPGEGILNICGELNLNSYCCPIDDRIWQAMMIPWYSSVMRHMLLAGCDVEMFFVGTDKSWPNYGLFLGEGANAGQRSAASFAKELFATHAPPGCQLVPTTVTDSTTVEALATRHDGHRCSVLLIHKAVGNKSVNLTIVGAVVREPTWQVMDAWSYDMGRISSGPGVPGSPQATTLPPYALKVITFEDVTYAAADYDHDGDADLADFAFFQVCFNGPQRPPAFPECDTADGDRDGDVDLADFSMFLACFNGAERPAAPGCPDAQT